MLGIVTTPRIPLETAADRAVASDRLRELGWVLEGWWSADSEDALRMMLRALPNGMLHRAALRYAQLVQPIWEAAYPGDPRFARCLELRQIWLREQADGVPVSARVDMLPSVKALASDVHGISGRFSSGAEAAAAALWAACDDEGWWLVQSAPRPWEVRRAAEVAIRGCVTDVIEARVREAIKLPGELIRYRGLQPRRQAIEAQASMEMLQITVELMLANPPAKPPPGKPMR